MTTATLPETQPLGVKASEEQVRLWIEQFHRDGFLFLHNILPVELIPPLKADLDRVLDARPDRGGDGDIQLETRMFEQSAANLSLFDLEPIASFAEALIGNDAGGVQNVHVIHNNSFRNGRGKGITGWHQDDPSHYIVTEGQAPANVRLPVLLFTANYYLTDVEEVKYGPTQVIPGSHLFGRPLPADLTGTPWESKIVSCCGNAGSVVMFNNQVWHRGGPNLTDRTRYITQISYARRMVGHRYYPFMNYQMPEHVYKDASPRRKRLLGFLASGPYG